MATMNDSGWSPIHHATFKNHLTLVERLIESSGYEHLEKKTNDTLQNTPLLLAVARGSGPMVKLLVNHGADVTYLNTCRQGVIEISTLFGHVNLIKYFISLHNKNLNVYKKLVALVDQDSEDGVNRACFIISKLTSLAEDQESICHLSNFVDEGLVFQLVDVLKKSIAENVKIQTLNVLKPILGNKNVRKKMMEVEGFQVFVSLIFSSSALLLPAVMGCICELATDKDFEEDLLATVIPALNKVVSSLGQGNQEDVLQSILNVLDHLAAVSAVCKDTIGKEAGLLGTLVKFFKTCQTNSLMLTWSEAIGSIAEGNLNNQNILLSENIGLCLHQLLKSQKREVLMSAVKTIYRLVEGNPQAQTKVLQSNNFSPLIQLLKRSKSQLTHEAIAKTLWALSGLDTETQRMVAARIGHSENLELIGKGSGFSYSYILHLLHSSDEEVCLTAGEALATFAFKSTSQQKEIIQNGGLVWRDFAKLLESTNQNHRTSTAFQLVVLAPIISDQKPSYTCALGIQTLVGLLETTQPYDTLALAADCVARLSLTRAGLSAAMVSIDIVNLLCPLLSSPSQQVRGSASIALSHLSFNPVAERQLLQRCRRDPKLIKVLIYYNKKRKWSENFLERWRHIRELTLPPIRRTAVFVTSSDKQRNDRGNIQSSAGNQMVTLPDFLNNRQSEMRRKNHCLSV
ncbi:ankyrin and armadillo repeat-containing protein isoform X2 [Hyla sarda]|uniref:ankyrin and armadillo repeat-containing protein isoform X2 n=1 Tax=Hyla sarda TaxID=327740 RepID=UPI0024C2DA8E|nr:ankyrin and armadillo repeat-containing protein isoform X2 [Hyla sarda]